MACVSTPSIYFSLPPSQKANATLFDLDEAFARRSSFVKYDFDYPEAIPEPLRGTFDLVVIDPPFITQEVWEKYAEAARLLLVPEGRLILSTICENEAMLQALLGVHPVEFRPSIPNLVYQYSFYANYPTAVLSKRNPEVDG